MKPRIVLLLLFAFAFVLFTVGCGQISDSAKYSIMATSYATTVEGIVAASKADLIDLEDMQKMEPIKEKLNAEIDAMGQALIDRKKIDFNFALHRANILLDDLMVAKIKAGTVGGTGAP